MKFNTDVQKYTPAHELSTQVENYRDKVISELIGFSFFILYIIRPIHWRDPITGPICSSILPGDAFSHVTFS
jgi:hypothetical protein